MAKQITATGRTVDEAIFNGMNQLEISIDEVLIEVISNEVKGVFGLGARPAMVKLTVREDMDEDTKPDFLMESRGESHSHFTRSDDENVPGHSRESRCGSHNSQRANDENASGYMRGAARPPRHNDSYRQNTHTNHAATSESVGAVGQEDGQRPAYERNESRIGEGRENSRNAFESAIDYSEEAAKDSAAAAFLAEIVSKMGFEANVLAYVEEGSTRLRIDSQETGILIGHRGETLDALQYLTVLAVNKERKHGEYMHISVDTEGYREKREEVLMRLARSKASMVRASGRPYRFEPMTPHERRIIHCALQNNNSVTSFSEGTEPYRYVIISPKQGSQRGAYRPRNGGYNRNARSNGDNNSPSNE